VVAQVDEEQAAMVAHAMDPARQTDILSRVGFPQLCAGVAAVAMLGHVVVRAMVTPATAAGQNRAEKRMGTPICQGKDGFAPLPGGTALAIKPSMAQ